MNAAGENGGRPPQGWEPQQEPRRAAGVPGEGVTAPPWRSLRPPRMVARAAGGATTETPPACAAQPPARADHGLRCFPTVRHSPHSLMPYQFPGPRDMLSASRAWRKVRSASSMDFGITRAWLTAMLPRSVG